MEREKELEKYKKDIIKMVINSIFLVIALGVLIRYDIITIHLLQTFLGTILVMFLMITLIELFYKVKLVRLKNK